MTRRLFYRKLLTTPNFFELFATHLDRIFTNGWIYDIEEQDDVVCAVESTVGWQEALKKTCSELNIYDAYEYWKSLEWDESDMFDAEISELLCAIIYDENNKRISN